MDSHVRAAFIVFCLAATPVVRAADMCPAPPKYQDPIASDIAADDHRIHIDSNDAVLDAEGNAVLNGRVNVRQDDRTRDLLIRQRSSLISAIRAHFAEFGIVVGQGIRNVERLLALLETAGDHRTG